MIKAEKISGYRPPELKNLPNFNVKEIYVAGNRGVCGGVEMTLAAVSQIMEIVPKHLDIYTTNTPVNFPPAFEKYGERLKSVNGDISKVPDGAILIISAHGASPQVFEETKQRKIFAIDTTCPLVLNEQEKVKEAAKENFHTIFLGEDQHPETIGIKGQISSDQITVFDPSKPIPSVSIPDGARIFAKTTNDPEKTLAMIKDIQRLNPNTDASRAHSCYALRNRFAAAKTLVKDVDYWLVVGDQSSHNAKGLRSVADGQKQIPSALVRGPEDINWNDFNYQIKIIGVSAAASAPEEHTQKTLDAFRQLGVNVVELAQEIPEAYRMFRLPQIQIDELKQRYA